MLMEFEVIVTTVCCIVLVCIIAVLGFPLSRQRSANRQRGSTPYQTTAPWLGKKPDSHVYTEAILKDLHYLRKQLLFHDNFGSRPLYGTSLEPLRGRYVEDMPKDPWGRDYMVDSHIGMILTFGEDGVAGGAGYNTDYTVAYRDPLSIERVQLDGDWGRPQKGSHLIVSFTRGVCVHSQEQMLKGVQLLRTPGERTPEGGASGSPVSFEDQNCMGEVPPMWEVPVRRDGSDTEDRERYKFQQHYHGAVSLYNSRTAEGEGVQCILPGMAVNLDINTPSTVQGAEYGFSEFPIKGGPLDAELYGEEVLYHLSPARPVPLYGYKNIGIKIEKF